MEPEASHPLKPMMYIEIFPDCLNIYKFLPILVQFACFLA